MELLSDPHIWASFLSLTALEVILGIDNVIFIALVVNHLPAEQRKKARMIGLSLALLMRIGLLLGLVWIMKMVEPWFVVFGEEFSGKDILMLLGGGFLIVKATLSMHEEVAADAHHDGKEFKGGFSKTIMQIIFIDIIFSFDSVMTAVGLTQVIPVIVAAMVIAMLVMLLASGFIADFIEKNPTFKMLALAFILLVGVLLVGEGLGLHVPKGYIYFGMAFSAGVEILNTVVRKKKAKS